MLLNGLYALDLRIALLKDPLYNALDGHLSARASCTVALQADFHDIVICIFYKLNISTISLQKRSDLIQCVVDFLFHNKSPFYC